MAAFAAKQNAVGAFVCYQFHTTAFGASLCSGERIHHAHHFGCRGMLKADDVDVFIATLVDALDDPGEPVHVVGAVRDDEDVRRWVGGQMAVLRNERAQNGHQLRRTDVPHLQDLRDDFVGAAADFVGQVVRRNLPGVGIRNNLPHAARGHGHEAMHLQDGQEGFVERVRRHGRRRKHGDLRLGAWVDDEVLASDLAHGLNNLPEVGVFVVRCDERAVGAIAGRRNDRIHGRHGCRRSTRLLRQRGRHEAWTGSQHGQHGQGERQST